MGTLIMKLGDNQECYYYLGHKQSRADFRFGVLVEELNIDQQNLIEACKTHSDWFSVYDEEFVKFEK